MLVSQTGILGAIESAHHNRISPLFLNPSGRGTLTGTEVHATQSSLWDLGKWGNGKQFALSVAPTIPASVISIYHMAETNDKHGDQGRDGIQRINGCALATTITWQKAFLCEARTTPSTNPSRAHLSIPSYHSRISSRP